MTTYSAKLAEIKREWHLFDAQDQVLGRLATQVATLLIGKHKPRYTPNLDGGDYVVIVNTGKIVLTGRKSTQKKYYHHSGYPGGLKTATADKVMQKDPCIIVRHAIAGMLPDNKLKSPRLVRLKLIVGADHPFKNKLIIHTS